MEKQLTPQESLAIISTMIEKTKHSISDKSHYFLLWGYAVFIGCTLQFTLKKLEYEKHYLAWLVTVAAIILHIAFSIRDSKREKVSTYASDANAYLWMGIGFSFMVLAFIFSYMEQGWRYCFPFYILFYGLGTFVSGGMLRYKPLMIGGGICYVLAVVAVFIDYDMQILLTAISIFISYIIPGHMLRMEYRKQKQVVS